MEENSSLKDDCVLWSLSSRVSGIASMHENTITATHIMPQKKEM